MNVDVLRYVLQIRHAFPYLIGLSRIPIPEGLPPLDPASLDAHLTLLLNKYTLNGLPILVHCRGGVGRAGVVACCWALKLGLCGVVEQVSASSGSGGSSSGTAGLWGPLSAVRLIRPDTLHLVEKVLGLVRRRRSVKAVETFEQVRFLVDYVEYLRGKDSGEEV